MTNKLFFSLAFSFVAWSTADYFSLHPWGLSQLTWIRIVMFLAVWLSLNVFLTFDTFPDTSFSKRLKLRKIAILLAFVSMILSLTPLVFKDITVTNGNAQPTPNFGIAFFGITVLFLLGGGIVSLIRRSERSKKREKAQIRIVLIGLAVTFSLIVASNFLFVILIKSSSLVQFGPAYTLIFCSSLAYAITRLKLFDIRAAIARAITYLMLLFTLSAIYGIVVFGLTNILFANEQLTLRVKITYLFISIIIAVTLQPLRKFFDKVSNRLFYRDAYDPQAFLDQLNKNLVTNVEINKLLTQSSNIIVDNIKTEFCNFFIKDASYLTHRNVGNLQKDISEDDVVAIDHFIKQHKHKVILTESLIDYPDASQLYKMLVSNNIGVVARVYTHSLVDVKGASYILMGYKKSGNPYNSEDLQTMDIITNELEIAIQNAIRFEEIEKFNVTLQSEVEDATRQLRMSNQKLKALDEAKDEFISMASHQLRTPLTSVKGYLSMLAEGDAGKLNETQRKFIDQAFISSQRMVYLIADLLNVSRLKTGKFIIESHPIYLPDVIESEIAQLYETVKARGLTMSYNKPKEFPTLNLDETKLRQVIMNFADNAIYYTPAGGTIVLALKEVGQSAEFTVTDDGMGVPRSEQQHLFTKFYRAGNARKARPDGTGLGLFMAKKVVVAQGGSLIFKSTEGKGSTFGFRFTVPKE